MKRPSEAIEIIQPDDVRRGMVIRTRFVAVAILVAMLVPFFTLRLDWLFSILLPLLIFFEAVFALVFFLITHFTLRISEPVSIFKDGILAFPSPYYLVRGLPRFIPLSRLERVLVKPELTTVQVARIDQGLKGRLMGDWLVIAEFSGGRARVIFCGSPQRALKASKAIETNLGVRTEWLGDSREMLNLARFEGYAIHPPLVETSTDIHTPFFSDKDIMIILPILVVTLLGSLVIWNPLIPIALSIMIAGTFLLLRLVLIEVPLSMSLGPSGIGLGLRFHRARMISWGNVSHLSISWGDAETFWEKSKLGGSISTQKGESFRLDYSSALILSRVVVELAPIL